MKKLLLTLFIWLIYSVTLYSQSNINKSVDSFKKIIHSSSAHDTTLADAYVSLADEYYGDSSMYFARKAIHIAEVGIRSSELNVIKNFLKRSKGDALLRLGDELKFNNESVKEAINCIDKSIVLFKQINNYKKLSDACHTKGDLYRHIGNSLEAVKFYKKSIQIGMKINYDEGIVVTRNNLGLVYYNLGKNKDAIRLFKDNIKTQKQIKDSIGLGYSYNNLGTIYRENGHMNEARSHLSIANNIFISIDYLEGVMLTCNNLGVFFKNMGAYPKAIEYYYNAIRISDKTNNLIEKGNAYNNLAFIYKNTNDSDKALEFYLKAHNYYSKKNDVSKSALVFNNIGLLYSDNGKLDSALVYYSKSLNIHEKTKNKRGIARLYNNIGIVYGKKGYKEKEMDYYFKSLQIRQNLNDKLGIANSFENIGKTYSELGNFYEAKKYGKSSLKIARECGNAEMIRNAASLLYTNGKKSKDYKTALINYEIFNKMSDSIKREENQKEIIRQEYKYVYDKQATADSIKAAEEKKVTDAQLAAQEAQLKQEEVQRYTLYGGLGLLFLFGSFMYNRFRVTNKQKGIIQQQKSEVELQKHEAEHQREIVEEKNKEILDSITYAKRLQDAILPSNKVVKSFLLQSFILYKPKDIVAGDFYFMDVVEEHEKKLIYYVAADCTGHGVPGAMVSIVGANGLKRCIQEFGLREPGRILDQLSEIVAANFSQSEERIRDGMDLTLCCLEIEKDQIKRVHYAGANNPLWVINSSRKKIPKNAIPFKEGGGFEIKANKQAIGYTENIAPFNTHTVELESGDTLYTFSDGYPDQFGGENGKKLKSANFRKILFEIQDKTMDKQLTILDKRFEEWRGELEQIDDVCVIGVRV